MLERFTSIGEAGSRLEEMLDEHLQGWLVTVDPSGWPQPTTVWFCRDAGSLVVYSEPGKPKLRNIAERPEVAFHLNSDRYGERWVVMVGTASIEELIPLRENAPYMDKYEHALKHWGFDVIEVERAYSVMVRFTPHRIRLRTR